MGNNVNEKQVLSKQQHFSWSSIIGGNSCCYSLFSAIVNWIYLFSGLLVGPKQGILIWLPSPGRYIGLALKQDYIQIKHKEIWSMMHSLKLTYYYRNSGCSFFIAGWWIILHLDLSQAVFAPGRIDLCTPVHVVWEPQFSGQIGCIYSSLVCVFFSSSSN